MTTVAIPHALRALTNGHAQVELAARDVRELVKTLDHRYPGFADALGEHFSVAIDGEIIQDAWLESVADAFEVHFLPALAGG